MIQKLLRGITVAVVAGVTLLSFGLPAHAADLGNSLTATGNLYTTWDNHQGLVTTISENNILVGGCACVYAYENLYYGPVSNNVVINQHSAVIGRESTATWYDPHDSLPYDCGSYTAAITIFDSNWGVLWSGTKSFCY